MSAILTAMSQTEQIIVALVIIVAAVAAVLLWRTIAPPKYPRKDDGKNGAQTSADEKESADEEQPYVNAPVGEIPDKGECSDDSAPTEREEHAEAELRQTAEGSESGDDSGQAEEQTEEKGAFARSEGIPSEEVRESGEEKDRAVRTQDATEYVEETDWDAEEEYVPFGGYAGGFGFEDVNPYVTPTLEEAFSSDTEGEEFETEESLSEDMANERREGRTKITFVSKIRATTPANRAIYNAVKNEILSYRGTHSRVVNGGDYFRKRGKQLAKIVLIGRTLRLAIALNPADYDYNIYHQHDRSGMKKYADTPMFVKVQSRVGVYRAAKLIADLMEKEGKRKNKKYIALDYAREIMLTDTEPVKSAPRDVEYRGEV